MTKAPGTLACVSLVMALGACAPSESEGSGVPASAEPASSSDAAPNDERNAPPGGDASTPVSPVIDVHDEGAAGDGVKDDAPSVEAALTKGAALGRTVFFPKGRYRLGAVVRIALGAGRVLTLEGQSGATLVGDAPEPADPEDETGLLDVTGAGDDDASEVHVAHLAVELARTSRGMLDGIQLRGGFSAVTLDDVHASGASRWGIAVVRARAGTITGGGAEDNRYGGLGLNAVANVKVKGGVYSHNGTVAPVDGYGISCMSSAIGPCVGVTITGVHADQNKRKGIDIHSGHAIVIDGNSVRGFESSGIYAVNEDEGKDVRDVTITNNVVDGAGAQHYVYGIEVGAFSALATASGAFTVHANTIRNTSFTTSSAIMVRNPSAGGMPTAKVVIDENVIQNGAAPDAYVIRSDNYDVPVTELVVNDNVLAATSAAAGIGLLRATKATVERNTITIGSGTVAYGILVSAPATASIANNALAGAAAYATPIAASSGQVLRANTLRGAALPDAN